MGSSSADGNGTERGQMMVGLIPDDKRRSNFTTRYVCSEWKSVSKCTEPHCVQLLSLNRKECEATAFTVSQQPDS